MKKMLALAFYSCTLLFLGSEEVSGMIPPNPYKQNNVIEIPPNPYNQGNNGDDDVPFVQINIPNGLDQPQTFDFEDERNGLYSNYRSPFSIAGVPNDNNVNNNNSNWNYFGTPEYGQDNLVTQNTNNDNDLTVRTNSDEELDVSQNLSSTNDCNEYGNLHQNFEAHIPQMDLGTVEACLINVELEIQNCKNELANMLVVLQSVDDGDDESVNQLVPQIEDLRTQIADFRVKRDLLQKHKQELLDQMSLKDKTIYLTERTLSDDDVPSDPQTDETIEDTFQKIEREIRRIGKQIEREAQRAGKKIEREVQNFRDGTVKPFARNVKRFLKKL